MVCFQVVLMEMPHITDLLSAYLLSHLVMSDSLQPYGLYPTPQQASPSMGFSR